MLRLRHLVSIGLGSGALALAGCGDDAGSGPESAASPDSAPATTTPAAATTPSTPDAPGNQAAGTVRTAASGLEVPWDLALLPGATANAAASGALITERNTGQILRLSAQGGEPEPVMTVPGVEANGEGGLLGIAVPPGEADPKTAYVYFTTAQDNRVAAVDLASKRVTPILTGLEQGSIHNGGALEFGPDGKLYVGVGETGQTGLSQDPSSRNGKILRINSSGSIPGDNPIEGSPVWTLGHRNVQGLAWDSSGRMWASEFGQNTTDEVNLISKGKNYGWPDVEGEGDTDGGKFTNSVVTWNPTSSSSPSGAAVAGDALYVSALAGQKLWQIPLNGTKAGEPKALFEGKYGRIRGVAAAGNGDVWFTTSNLDGRGEPQDGDDHVFVLAG